MILSADYLNFTQMTPTTFVLLTIEDPFLRNYGYRDSKPHHGNDLIYSIDQQFPSQTYNQKGRGTLLVHMVFIYVLWNQFLLLHTFHILKITFNVSVKVINKICFGWESVLLFNHRHYYATVAIIFQTLIGIWSLRSLLVHSTSTHWF